MTHSGDTVGVGKDDLEIYALPAAQARRLANTAAAHAQLARWLKALGVTAAVMEASGADSAQNPKPKGERPWVIVPLKT